MNWFGNLSSDCEQLVAPVQLVEGHWRHPLHAHGVPVLLRVVMDVAEPRVVAAQVIEHGTPLDVDSSVLESLAQSLLSQDVHHQPKAWGFVSCTMLPDWAKPTFSESQIEELQRIEGYLIEASDDNIDSVLQLRDEFLKGIGVTDKHMYRAVRQTPQFGHKHGRNRVS